MSNFSFREAKTGQKPNPDYTPKSDYIPHGCGTPGYRRSTPPPVPEGSKKYLKVCSVRNDIPDEHHMAWKIQEAIHEMEEDVGASNFKLVSVFPNIRRGQIEGYIAFFTCEILVKEKRS